MALGDWTTIRTLVAQAPESAIPSSTFVSVGGVTPKVQVRLRVGAETGALVTAATGPSAVVLTVWRRQAGKADPVGTISATVTANAVTATAPLLIEAWSEEFTVTVASFTGGSTPTLAGVVEARALTL